MTLIRIDETICKKDGFCVQECPVAILKQKDKDSFPVMVNGGEAFCIACGHCVAVCSHGAFSHVNVPLEACPSIEKEKIISSDQAIQFLRSRRSIRRYKSKTLAKETIQQLIEIARYAPTGSNAQPLEWTVFTKKEDLRKISELTVEWIRKAMNSPAAKDMPAYFSTIVAGWDFGLDVILRDAPALVIASAPGETGRNMVDPSIALTYLDLAASSMGLGACWAGLVQMALLYSKSAREFVSLPLNHNNHYPMMMGYPKFRYHHLPERKVPVIHWRG